MNEGQASDLYEFGEFVLDVKACALRRGDEVVAIAPKAFDVLRLLVEKQGAVISKQEMMEEVWADSFVEDANMTQSIYMLRRVLGKNEEGKNFIENVPRRGYRLAVPVRVIERNGKSEKVPDSSPSGVATISHAADDTSPLAENQTAIESPVPTRRRKPLLIGLGAGFILLTAFVTLAAFYFYRPKAAPKSPIEEIVFQKLTYTGDVSVPVISPDGVSFAFERNGSLYVQDIKTGNNIRLNIPGHETFGHLQFSSGGEFVYFRNRSRVDLAGEVLYVPRFGGEARRIAENVWSGFGISPDGRSIAFIRFYPEQAESALMVKNLETGEERKLLTRKPPEDFYRGKPAWSADGKKIATIIQTPQQTQTQISKLFVVEAESGNAEEIKVPRLFQMEQPAWSPEGDALVIVGREDRRFMQLWRVSYPLGEVRKITNDLNIYRGLSLSADGKNLLAYQYSFYSHLWVAPADDTASATQITFGNLNRDGNAGLAWLPDGSLVYCSRIMGDRDLWVVRPSDGLRRQLTESAGGYNEEPFVTADGKYIFFESTRSGTQHIWRMDANGENPTQMTFSEKETESFPAISPDGNHLYFIQKSPKASAVWRKSLTDGKLEPLTAAGHISPAGFLELSPDGRFLAFHNLTGKRDENSAGQIFQIGIISTNGEAEPRFFRLKSSGTTIKWAHEGGAFDYVENGAGGAKLWRQTLDEKSPPKLILHIPGAEIYNFAWTSDGKNLALARGKQQNDVVLLTNFE